MSLYEGMFLIDNRQANRDWDACLATLTSLLTKHDAKILRTVKWGERRLAYEIDGRRRATYVLIYFEADGEASNRIYRECELSEMLHRALILKVPKLPPEEETRPYEERPARDRHGRSAAPAAKAPAEKPVVVEEASAEKPAAVAAEAPAEKKDEEASPAEEAPKAESDTAEDPEATETETKEDTAS